MAHLRFEALKKLSERPRVHVDLPNANVSKFFGENVYGMEQMRGTLARPFSRRLARLSKITKKLMK